MCALKNIPENEIVNTKKNNSNKQKIYKEIENNKNNKQQNNKKLKQQKYKENIQRNCKQQYLKN